MRVGFARVRLPVPPGTPMGGYTFREGTAIGTLDSLTISIITWYDGQRRAALALADVICVNSDLTQAVRAAVPDVDMLWLAASHTHAGPETGCVPGGAATPAAWLDAIQTAVQRAAALAVHAERESDGYAYTGALRDVGAVRSSAGSDPVVPLDVVEVIAGGRRAGLLVVLPVHPTVLPSDNLLVSADLTGAVRRSLSRRLEPGTWLAVATGAAGDISTRHTRQGTGPGELERLGDLVAARCADLLAGPGRTAWTEDSAIAWQTRTVQLEPKAAISDVDSLMTAASSALATARREDDPVAQRIATGNLHGARLAARFAPPWHDIDAEVAALRLGELALAALPGEPFLGLADTIRSGRGAPTLVLGYANGYPGYLPDRAAYAATGYEVLAAAAAPGSGERLAQTAAALITDIDRSNP